MDTSATNRRLRVLLTSIGKGTLIPRPDFQRKLVWSNKDKVSFIETVLHGYPFPEIYIAAGKVDSETGEGTELLVDGQQRLTTLYQYFKGSDELRLGRGLKPYKELEEQQKLDFLEYSVVVRDLGSHPIEVIKEIFQRINSTSYGLNAMEIHNARYGGEFKKFGDRLAEISFFEEIKLFTTNDAKRMNDVRYCLVLAITMLSTYFNRDDELEEYLEKYNEFFDEADDLYAETIKVVDFIKRVNLATDSRAWKKADFFTLFIEIHRYLIKKRKTLSMDNLRAKLSKFYEGVRRASEGIEDEISDFARYYKATLQASNDRSSRILRGEIISKILLACEDFEAAK
jgi:uncharacterized protein with ParB-like and HNH nuclease domain